MSRRVDLARDAKKELAWLSDGGAEAGRSRAPFARREPFPRGCKKLKNRDGWRVRVGDYRILYFADKTAREIVVGVIGAPAGRLSEIAPAVAEPPTW